MPTLPSFPQNDWGWHEHCTTVTLTPVKNSADCRRLELLAGKSLTIGRASTSDTKNIRADKSNALFSCPVISRVHAELRAVNNDLVTIVDKGSLHGTWVNRIKLQEDQPMTLRPGDQIQLGTEVSRGDRVHNGLLITFDYGPTTSPEPETTPMDGPKAHKGFHVNVPSASESEDELSVISDDDFDDDDIPAGISSSAQTTPESVKVQPGSMDRPIDLESIPSRYLDPVIIDDDDEDQEEVLISHTAPEASPRGGDQAKSMVPDSIEVQVSRNIIDKPSRDPIVFTDSLDVDDHSDDASDRMAESDYTSSEVAEPSDSAHNFFSDSAGQNEEDAHVTVGGSSQYRTHTATDDCGEEQSQVNADVLPDLRQASPEFVSSGTGAPTDQLLGRELYHSSLDVLPPRPSAPTPGHPRYDPVRASPALYATEAALPSAPGTWRRFDEPSLPFACGHFDAPFPLGPMEAPTNLYTPEHHPEEPVYDGLAHIYDPTQLPHSISRFHEDFAQFKAPESPPHSQRLRPSKTKISIPDIVGDTIPTNQNRKSSAGTKRKAEQISTDHVGLPSEDIAAECVQDKTAVHDVSIEGDVAAVATPVSPIGHIAKRARVEDGSSARRMLTSAVKYAGAATIGGAGMFAFLCSPASEKVISWLS